MPQAGRRLCLHGQCRGHVATALHDLWTRLYRLFRLQRSWPTFLALPRSPDEAVPEPCLAPRLGLRRRTPSLLRDARTFSASHAMTADLSHRTAPRLIGICLGKSPAAINRYIVEPLNPVIRSTSTRRSNTSSSYISKPSLALSFRGAVTSPTPAAKGFRPFSDHKPNLQNHETRTAHPSRMRSSGWAHERRHFATSRGPSGAAAHASGGATNIAPLISAKCRRYPAEAGHLGTPTGRRTFSAADNKPYRQQAQPLRANSGHCTPNATGGTTVVAGCWLSAWQGRTTDVSAPTGHDRHHPRTLRPIRGCRTDAANVQKATLAGAVNLRPGGPGGLTRHSAENSPVGSTPAALPMNRNQPRTRSPAGVTHALRPPCRVPRCRTPTHLPISVRRLSSRSERWYARSTLLPTACASAISVIAAGVVGALARPIPETGSEAVDGRLPGHAVVPQHLGQGHVAHGAAAPARRRKHEVAFVAQRLHPFQDRKGGFGKRHAVLGQSLHPAPRESSKGGSRGRLRPTSRRGLPRNGKR